MVRAKTRRDNARDDRETPMTPTNAMARTLRCGAPLPLLLFLSLFSAGAGLAQASGYPDHPVKIIVPFAPAGPTDVAQG
jgi:hypothetical protein